jgi:hypothetical protein
MTHDIPNDTNYIISRSLEPIPPQPTSAVKSDQVGNNSKTTSRFPVKNTKPPSPTLDIYTAHKAPLHRINIQSTPRPRYTHPKHAFKPTPLPIPTSPTTHNQPQPDTTELAQRGEKTTASQTHAVLHKLVGLLPFWAARSCPSQCIIYCHPYKPHSPRCRISATPAVDHSQCSRPHQTLHLLHQHDICVVDQL